MEETKAPLQAVKEDKPLHKKPVKENPNQSVKRLQADAIDKFKVFAMQQIYYNQQANARFDKVKTLQDIFAMKFIEGDLVEAALSKEELQELPNKFIIETGTFGPYAIEIDTLKFFKFISCLEGYELTEPATELPKVEVAEGEQPAPTHLFKFQKKGLESTPIEIQASSDPEAYGKLRNYILGL
jgi:hypothetical protein